GYTGGSGGYGGSFGGGGGAGGYGFIAGSATNVVTTAGKSGVNSGTGPDGSVTFTFVPATPVPEPGSFALLGTALIGLGWTLRRKRRTDRPRSARVTP
ncbi:MAG: PEP-CTERM sorting domain-containing protein, partial [Acetobacteraceae bacterium]